MPLNLGFTNFESKGLAAKYMNYILYPSLPCPVRLYRVMLAWTNDGIIISNNLSRELKNGKIFLYSTQTCYQNLTLFLFLFHITVSLFRDDFYIGLNLPICCVIREKNFLQFKFVISYSLI